ncbi:MAG: T9SS type A sorting domain-containing protein [Ignavibacteriaceae bacterium]|nr:T9SS type A sorting domain-containing protein [Ignavibacteriaceae bacterium]
MAIPHTRTPIPTSTRIKNIILKNGGNPSQRANQEMIVAVESSPSDRIYKSTDGGASWYISLNNATFSFFGIPMTPDPNRFDTVYTMTNNIFMRTVDFGENWTTLSTPSGFATPCDIEVFPDSVNIILAGDNTTGIYRSTDYGVTWARVYQTSGEIPTIATPANSPGVAYATKWGGGGGFLRSTNYGLTWSELPGSVVGQSNWGVDVAPENPAYIVVGRYSGSNVYISRNTGQSWITTTLPSSNYSVVVVDTLTIFAAQSGGFYKLRVPYIPVELSSFSANVTGSHVRLDWTTATELNNSGFEIHRRELQKLSEGEWEVIAFVDGNGTTTEKNEYSFVDYPKFGTSYQYRLKQIDFDGTYEFSSFVEVDTDIPSEYALHQNYPNPFNPETILSFSLPSEINVSLKVYDILGNEVASLINNELYQAGNHRISFNAVNLASGMYIYKISTANFTAAKRMLLMK